MLNAFIKRLSKRIALGIFIVLTSFLFFSCKKSENRVYLDAWEYSLDDVNYTAIDSKGIGTLEKIVPEKKGYIYIKSKFNIPSSMNLNSYGICVGRVNLASEIYFDGKMVAETGIFPPEKFSNGDRYTFLLLPSNIVNQNGENELKLKIYIEGKGGIHGHSFVGEYKDASNAVTVNNFLHSTLFLLVAAFMLFTGSVYLVMFFKMQHDLAMIFFSLMSLSTIFFLFPSFVGSFPWILGFMNYDWFIKIFQGCFAMITAFLAVSFSSHYIGLRQPMYFILLRVGILIAGIIYCLFIPDTLHFYNLTFVTVVVIMIQVISFIPSAIIGLKMRAKIMRMVMSGEQSPVNFRNLPKGIPVGKTIAITTDKTQEQPQSIEKTENNAETSSEHPTPQAKTPTQPMEAADVEESPKEETPSEPMSPYGIPPANIRKMLEERAAQFERMSKIPILPPPMRKSMKDKAQHFIDMAAGRKSPPAFIISSMGLTPQVSSPNGTGGQTQSAGQKPSPVSNSQQQNPKTSVGENAPSVAMKMPSNPVKTAKVPQMGASVQPSEIGKANPPSFVKKMIEAQKSGENPTAGQIPIPGMSAVPLTGALDDISMAQLKYAENTIGTIKQIVMGYLPTFLTIILDVILRFVLDTDDLPYFTLFGWQCTIVVFLFMLITNFAKIRKRGEYLSKNLREIVFKSTEELKQKAEELEKKNLQGQKDLEMAAQVQKSFYPANENFYGWDLAVDFRPLSNVSGDLYDFYEMEGNLRGFGVFDVSGHGISAGLVTMLAKNSIFRAFRSSLSINLSEAILRINKEIIRAKGNIENYLTGVLVRIDRDDPSKIELVNAGSPYPILKSLNEEARLLKPAVDDAKAQHGMLGIKGLDVAFCTIPFTLKDEDTLVLYTDGLTEAENTEGEQYGKERLLKVISEIPDGSDSNTVLERIKANFREFVGSQPLDDDITVLVVRRIEEVAVIGADDDDVEGELEELEDGED